MLPKSAQPYRDTHIFARINEYRWTMRSLNGAYIYRLLQNHVVISDLDARERQIMGYRKKSPHSHVCSSCKIGLLCSADVALVQVLRTAFTRLVQKRVRLKTCLRSLIRAVFRRNSIMRKDTVCHVRTTNTKIRLHSKLN